jgi:hypothetical protein
MAATVLTPAWRRKFPGCYIRKDGVGQVIIERDGKWLPTAKNAMWDKTKTAKEAMALIDREFPPCSQCEGTGRFCGYHGVNSPDCSCASDCPCSHG